MVRPVARQLGIAATRWPASARLAALAFVVRRAAGPADGLSAFARRLLDRPGVPDDAVRRLVELTYDARLRDVAAEGVARIPGDDRPSLEPARFQLAFTEGRYRDAIAHGRKAVEAGIPRGATMVALATAHLDVLRPEWTPALGSAAPRLRALRGKAVPGRVLHVVSVSQPHRLAGYTVRTQDVIESQIAAGFDAQAMVRSGFPRGTGGRPGRVDRVGTVAYHRVEPVPWSGRPDEMIGRVVIAATDLVERLRPAVLQPASNHIQARIALTLGHESAASPWCMRCAGSGRRAGHRASPAARRPRWRRTATG